MPKKAPNLDREEEELTRLLARFLARQGGELLELLGDPPNLDNIPPDFWDKHARELTPRLVDFLDGVTDGQIEELMQDAQLSAMPIDWTLINERAVSWAWEHVGELIRGIDDTTKQRVRDRIADFFLADVPREELERQILKLNFSSVRAEMIAITEVTSAAAQSEKLVAEELQAQGINMQPIHRTREDDLVCPTCGPRADEPITNDSQWPPLHPRCRCFVSLELLEVESA